jgi:hypothetical protein
MGVSFETQGGALDGLSRNESGHKYCGGCGAIDVESEFTNFWVSTTYERQSQYMDLSKVCALDEMS